MIPIRVAAGTTQMPVVIRFAIVGLITTTIDIACFFLLSALGLIVPAANFLSYSCGIAASYLLNSAWTFRAERSGIQAFKFAASTFTGLLLSTCLVVVFNLLLPALISKIVSVPIVFLWNYGMARFWVFRHR